MHCAFSTNVARVDEKTGPFPGFSHEAAVQLYETFLLGQATMPPNLDHQPQASSETQDGYMYEVFLSYPHGKRDRDIAKWVQEIFYEYFSLCIDNSSLGRGVRIHLDTKDIKPGAKWKAVLKEALARTKILIPILSINYFRSFYCRAELAVFLHRERQLGYWHKGNEKSLIVPVHLWGIVETFPEVIREYQYLDCEKYGNVREGSELHEMFKNYLKNEVLKLAETIKSAPDWNPAWCKKEWLDDPINNAEASRVLWPPNEDYDLPASMGSF